MTYQRYNYFSNDKCYIFVGFLVIHLVTQQRNNFFYIICSKTKAYFLSKIVVVYRKISIESFIKLCLSIIIILLLKFVHD